MSDSAQIRAANAERLLSELDPYLKKLETVALDAAVVHRWKTDNGGEPASRLLERVSVIRSIRGELQTEIQLGNHADQKEAEAEPGRSPYV